MTTRFCRLGFALLLIFAGTTHGVADEQAVRATLSKYLDAFNQHDADAVVAFWLEDAVHHDRETGIRTEGRDQIGADLKAAFEGSARPRLTGRVEHIQFITPEVAKIAGETELSRADEDPIQIAYTAIMVKREGGWRFSAIEESPVPVPESAYDALRNLEWLVGRWRDEGQDQTVESEIDWSPGGNFMIRSYVIVQDGIESGQGTEVIGWDPRAEQIRSWSFNSDGSFGDGVWSESGDRWLVRTSQTLADGRAASGTYVVSQEAEDSLTVRLIGHEIEGEPQPNRDAVVMKRVSADPSEGAAAASNALNPDALVDAGPATSTKEEN